jgi:2,4-dienoyl-CoA reductase-like NADH-dependent reductase (Old Yellow Enzyme family)
MSEVFPRLFSPTKLAGYALKNCMATAPLTRQMAEPDGAPTDEMAACYGWRARGGCGLILTEGTYHEDGPGYPVAMDDPNWTGAASSKSAIQARGGRAKASNEGEKS